MNNIKKTIFKTGFEDTPSIFTYNFSIGQELVGLACQETTFPITLYSASSVIIVSSVLYTDIGLTTTYNGQTDWFKMGTKTYRINTVGIVTEISIDCSGVLPLIRYCYVGIYDPDDPIHVPPGGVVDYTDEFGVPQTRSNITTASGIVSIYSSTVPVEVGGGSGEVTCP